MTTWICSTCGLEHPDTEHPPETCAICEDERQYVPDSGQSWTTHRALAEAGHRVSVQELEPDLYAVRCSPRFAIGQRGLLLRTPQGNLLWEPPGVFDAAAVAAIQDLGGAAVITASHPHLVGASVSYSHALGDVPVLVAEADRAWVRRPDPVVQFWGGTREVLPGVKLLECGGHFAGSAVAHWAAGAQGRGVLLTGDTIFVGGDRASVSAMRSYVNLIPLPAPAIRRIRETVAPYAFDRLYGGFDHAVIDTGAHRVVVDSLTRYLGWIGGELVPQEER
ncbi:hypothetical protein [Kineosporia sp. NBRC 101731]|uniref:hypothetical protein n=1 Tax=Kineosporia sp. NBRC 101731 TaxID=3032199 RepID=UPI0024A4E314|nr:hypothetical protein [Kineosporia sp. NBRC 101731]GLY32272.1 hydrolase [Kineosporia sp. NBRC 101731]